MNKDQPQSRSGDELTMNTIKRYELEDVGLRDVSHYVMSEDPDGEYVKFEDAARIVARLLTQPGFVLDDSTGGPVTVVRSETGRISVSRSLAERTEAMFRSVDPQGGIAQEWKEALK
jgi:hypothetical protein